MKAMHQEQGLADKRADPSFRAQPGLTGPVQQSWQMHEAKHILSALSSGQAPPDVPDKPQERAFEHKCPTPKPIEGNWGHPNTVHELHLETCTEDLPVQFNPQVIKLCRGVFLKCFDQA